MRCKARTKRGLKCRALALKNKLYCKHHSRVTQMDRNSGRYSANIPKHLLKDYEAGIADPNLTTLRDDIALFDARINELLSQIDSGENPDMWLDLQRSWGNFMDAVREGDADKQRTLLPAINTLIIRGASKASAWKELGIVLEKRRKMVESEQKRLVSTSQMIAVEQVMHLMAATINALRKVVNKHVPRETAHVILADASIEYDRLLGPTSSGEDRAIITVEPR
jgi:hypothetical protein